MKFRFIVAALLCSGCHLHLGVPDSVRASCRGNEKCLTYCSDYQDEPLGKRYCKQLQNEQVPGYKEPKRPVPVKTAKVRVLEVGISPLTTEEIVAQSLPAVVTVHTGRGWGTGFVATTDGFIVTNYHVIEGQSDIAIELANGYREQVSEIAAYSERFDLAILRVSGVSVALPIGRGQLAEVGESLVAIGHPLGFTSSVATGVLSGYRQTDENLWQIQTTVPMSSGASGGPLMDKHGRVIGVMQAMIVEGQLLTFAIPIDYLRALLIFAKLNPNPLPIAEFAQNTTTIEPELETEITPSEPTAPPVAPAVLKGCSKADRALIDLTCAETIATAKNLCESENASCVYLLVGAAMSLETSLSAACAGPKAMLSQARTKTLKQNETAEQIKALRPILESLGAGVK
jgi:hypothetical protein